MQNNSRTIDGRIYSKRQPRDSAHQVFTEILSHITKLTRVDLRIAAKYCEYSDLMSEVQSKVKDPGSSSTMRRNLSRIQPLGQSLATLYKNFAELIDPLELRFDLIWGLVYLTLRVGFLMNRRCGC